VVCFFISTLLRIPAIIGCLVAGVPVVPATPGYVADIALSEQLADIGVILLMFGVGLHLSIPELLSVRKIAIPGAIAQITFTTFVGFLLAHGLGLPTGAALVFGLALSVSSTVVVLKALERRGLL